MIRCVKIKGYKSLKDVEINLMPLSVIIGPNASGKSNLLDALGLISQMVTSRTLEEAFEKHRGERLEAFHYGDGGKKQLLSQTSAQFSIEVDVQLSPSVVQNIEEKIQQNRAGLESHKSRRKVHETQLRYLLTVEMMIDSGYLRVVDERLVALKKDGSEKISRKPFIKREESRLHLRMEGQAHPTYHEVGLDYTLASMPLYMPHYPHISAFREEASRWRFYYLEPKSMREKIALKDVKSLGPFGEDLAAYYNSLKAKNPKQFEAVNRALAQLLPGIQGFDVERDNEGFLQIQILENHVPFSANIISEGTLRILGLLAITAPLSLTTVIGYEEPENGVHPRRIKLIADLLQNTADFGKTQMIVNTHSPLLPKYVEDESLIVCRKDGRETTFVPFTSLPLFRNRKVEDALDEAPETSFTERIVRGDFDG